MSKFALFALAASSAIIATQACGFAAPISYAPPVAIAPIVRPVAWGYASNNCCANTCGGFNSPWRVWNEEDSKASAHDDDEHKEICEEECDETCDCEEFENDNSSVNVFDLEDESSDSLCWDEVEEESTSCEVVE